MVRTLARLFGFGFILVGVLGFIPATAPNGLLLGSFPVSALHNIVHILLGLWALGAAGSMAGAVSYMRSLTVIYAALAILGLIPATQDLFGLVPLHGADVYLHAGLAVVAAWAGFGPPSKAVA
jgi:hypothetical protein